jgi:hypothetical protein
VSVVWESTTALGCFRGDFTVFLLIYSTANSDCAALAETGVANGIHDIHPSTLDPFSAYCHNGWTIIQTRIGHEENFNRVWKDYKLGFGDQRSGNYWLGLENIYHLTNARR